MDGSRLARNWRRHGSVDPVTGRAGAAFVCPECDEKRKLHLFDNTTPEMAELIAIQKAVQWLETQGRFKESVILTDAINVLRRLKRPDETSEVILNIRQRVSTLRTRGRLVTFFWIPAHAGISGNGKAHALAQQAARDTSTGKSGITRAYPFSSEHGHSPELPWVIVPSPASQDEQTDENCVNTAEEPSPTSSSEFYTRCKVERKLQLRASLGVKRPVIPQHWPRKWHPIVHRIRTGSARTPHFRATRFGSLDDPECSRCSANNDIAHILWDCPRFADCREQASLPFELTLLSYT